MTLYGLGEGWYCGVEIRGGSTVVAPAKQNIKKRFYHGFEQSKQCLVGPHCSPETGDRVVVRVLEAPEGGGGDGDPASILRLGGRGENLSSVEFFNFNI